ncbi:PQQ-dependent sugar dehydrogenase [Myxococcus sp. AM011]|uniref:PQQ-dependent sugar dehydrogenase n=1 Tax=Myxococcus sp. AM011 TaxID=2745200 RepID=UPI0015959468|nr:PQQ-dependent sugar dehydrogenase [Myxococcus sp. AM011]NVJ23812.1 PQQ-dependent sugar dehydrogenase [Myxococcus sp. AM011]
MRTLLTTLACTTLLSFAGAAHGQAPAKPTKPSGNMAPGGAAGSQQSEPRQGPNPTGAPVETAPPNVPEFKPAFPGQTRAPGVQSRTQIQVTEVAKGFDKPWAIAFLPDQRMLVTEKPTGKLFIVTQKGEKSAPVAGLPPVDGRGQGGLLDVEVGPDYATSGLIYWSYYEPRKGGNGLAVARAKLVDGAKPKVEGLKVIFRMEPTLESTLHAGGRLVFAPDGKLFITLGERSVLPGRVQARDLKSDFGKIVRINPDGSIPKDNPFVGRKDARPEIWTLGHRNVLSAALDSQGRLWEVEMGPRGGDELNLIEKGKDYGWPTIGYGEEYSGAPIHKSTQGPGMEQPVYYWDPVISPSGMTIYSGDLFPEWKGNFFIGGLSSQALVRLVLKDDRVVGEERLLRDQDARIREVVQGPEGALYLLTDDDDGKLLKLTPR